MFYNTLPYAVSSLDMTATEILHTFVRFILGKFPYNTFKAKSVFVDSLGLVNDHKRGELGLEMLKLIQKPYVIVTNNGGLTDAWNKEDGGPDIRQYSMFPGTTKDRRLFNNHRLTFITDRKIGIYVDTIELRRKLELDIKFTFDTKSDISTIKSFLYSNLPIKIPSVLKDVKTSLVLPTVLLNDISKLMYDRNQFSVSNTADIDKLLSDLNDGRSVYNIYKKQKESDDSLLFLIDREIGINYFIKDTEGKDGEDNEKDGEVYDKFSFNLNCTLDFKLPNSFVLNYKVFNAPNKSMISLSYFDNIKLNYDAKFQVKFSEMKYIEDRDYIKPAQNGYELIVREEFLIENEKEIIQLSDFFPSDSIYKEILYRLTPQERKDLFEFHFYENSVLIEHFNIKTYDIESDFVFVIDKCDPTVSFMIFVYCNTEILKKVIPIILTRREQSIFPNVGENNIPLYVGSVPPRELNIIPPQFDEWDNTIEYEKDFVVMYNNTLYKSLNISTNVIPSDDETKWKKILKFWVPDETYLVGEYVVYNSMLYNALIENTGIIPSSDYISWRFVRILGEDYGSSFTLPLLSQEPVIGGKFLKGGIKGPTNKKRTIETFDCSIFACR